MKANKFVISGLNDSNNIPKIEQSIHSHDGVNAARVDMVANTITVDYDEGRLSVGDVKNFVDQTGLTVLKIK